MRLALAVAVTLVAGTAAAGAGEPGVHVETSHVDTALRRVMTAFVYLRNLEQGPVFAAARCYATVDGVASDAIGIAAAYLQPIQGGWQKVTILDVPEGADGIECTPHVGRP